MSRSGGAGAGGDPLPDRFNSALTLDKPDSKSFADLGSPVSPLRTRPAVSSSSSSSGSLGKLTLTNAARSAVKSHSGELSGSSDSSPTTNPRPGHRRSGSGPLIFSGSASTNPSTASSPITNALPAGNICPSGKIAGMVPRASVRADVLGTGTGNYGHGSVMRASAKTGESANLSSRRTILRQTDPQEVTRLGNECYKRGQFKEALGFYDRAVEICPETAACRNNRAAALTGLGRIEEAVKECEEAVRFDPAYGRAHHRLALLHLRLGQVESAKKHMSLVGGQLDPLELQKLQSVERHLERCSDLRKIGDWKSVLREADAAMAAGADSCLLLIASRAEALLRLHKLDEADSTLSAISKLDSSAASCSQSKAYGMVAGSYVYIVRARVEMALGRFESAVAAAEKARQIDSRSVEVTTVLNTVRSVASARAQGKDLFTSGNFAEASTAYGEGLRFDPLNPVLFCNRAICQAKLGHWERSIEDCNEALKIQPSYTKALLRRAASYAKLERWAEAVRDYEVLRKALPGDTEVAESLFHAQVALKTSRGEEVSNMKFGGEVEEITGLEQFKAAISLTGVSVVYFMAPSNKQCAQMSPAVDALCTKYPSVNFLKVDVNKNAGIAMAENVRTVPTFKIYKNGLRVKEIICPSQQVLEYSVRHYGL